MKKVISVVLSVILIVSSVIIGVSAQSEKPDLCFALASDLHYNPPGEELVHINNDPVLWYANRRCAMEDESGFIIDEFLNQCAEDDTVEYVLIAGDLVDDGRPMPESHRVIAEKLKAFEEKTGKSVFVINGNHDASVESNTTYDLFKEIYADLGYDKALDIREDDCSYAADLGEKYRLIALDTNHPTKSTEDGMTLDKLNWVHKQAKAAYDDGRYPIVMMHHNLLDHLPIQRIISRNFIVRFHFSTAELFADWGIKLVMTGHEHCSDTESFTSALGNKIYDVTTTSLTMYPLAYRYFTFTDEKIEFTTRNIESIDTDALTKTVKSYTDEQIKWMKEDLTGYSKQFLKVGVEYRLWRSLNMNKTDIDENAFYYDVVATAIDRLLEILETPLEGENGLRQQALAYGIELPETEYENGWDLVSEIMAWHYSGGEHFDLDSAEVNLLLRTVAFILRNDLETVNDDVLLKGANALLEKEGFSGISKELTQFCIDHFGTYTAAEYLLVAIASPIIYGFAYDDGGEMDQNGVMEGYGTSSFSANVSNIAENVSSISQKTNFYIKTIVNILLKLALKVLNYKVF